MEIAGTSVSGGFFFAFMLYCLLATLSVDLTHTNKELTRKCEIANKLLAYSICQAYTSWTDTSEYTTFVALLDGECASCYDVSSMPPILAKTVCTYNGAGDVREL